MDLTPYVDSLRRDLAVAADAGGDEARALAERLVAPLDSAVRLVLLDALSAAADEITVEVAPGSVEVRLRSGSPEFVVSLPPPEPDVVEASADPTPAAPGVPAPAPGEGDDGATARITLRLPESLKPRIDEAASRAGLSANAWLVRVVSAALDPVPPPSGNRAAHAAPEPGAAFGRRYTGWVS
jgi:hypothetical protein